MLQQQSENPPAFNDLRERPPLSWILLAVAPLWKVSKLTEI